MTPDELTGETTSRRRLGHHVVSIKLWTIVHPVCRVGDMLPKAPDTAAARAAVNLVHEVSDAPLVGHVWRTWFFGHQLIAEHVHDADVEVGFVAAMLHDLGLTPGFDCDAPFEQAGAAAAADTLAGLGWPQDRIALTAAAIGQHLDLASAEARPEIALVHLGAAADVIGLRVDNLPGELIEEVLTRKSGGVWAGPRFSRMRGAPKGPGN